MTMKAWYKSCTLLQSYTFAILLLVQSSKYCYSQSSNNGWSMADRFSGIRFEIRLKPPNAGVRSSGNSSTIKNDSNINTDIATLKQTIVAKADELACFGWVQDSFSNSPTTKNKRRSLVGEARCNKRMGYMMKRFLQGDDDDENIHFGMTEVALEQNTVLTKPKERVTGSEKKKNQLRDFINETIIRDYQDTKIKLHFSHFKILDERRETCFRDEPHKCENNDVDLL